MESLAHNPELQAKINRACLVIERVLENYKNPVILCSFGKDSVLLVHMIREWYKKDIPIVSFKLPHFPRKRAYAENLTAEWELEVHSNIPPSHASVAEGNGLTEVMLNYPIGANTLGVFVGKQKIEAKEKWLCGVNDLLKTRFGTFQWDWDVAFHGQKCSDIGEMTGLPIDTPNDIKQIPGSCDLAYPIRYFTDEDVWACFRAWNIPFNKLRYGSLESPSEDKEDAFNPDYFPYCTKCFEGDGPESVLCPKTGLQISNIKRLVQKERDLVKA